MRKSIPILAILTTQIHSTSPQQEPYTNLPDVPPGLFTSQARVEIHNTTLQAAWNALNDFSSYPDWNPFVRSALAVDAKNISLERNFPIEGAFLLMSTQIPPLPLPVNRYTPDNPLHINPAYELINHVQPDLHRLAWQFIPKEALAAERWQAVSDLGGGVVLYESREVFSGPLAQTLKDLLEEGLQASFEAQGAGLKLLLEGKGGKQ
ncbi:hypothetical protein GQ44DRAFT_712405 [Phaeosphaeriaceae sp. PMI808]|nr:hypothetical protein GQ44DRAFT_712405 [Phaeosphaeriaceae sp. PMI808]